MPADPAIVRRAMRNSQTKSFGEGKNPIKLPDEDTSGNDRAHFLFYQDEGGLRATDEFNDPLDTIYYLGVIDILTPWGPAKKLEGVWKGLSADRVSSSNLLVRRWVVTCGAAQDKPCRSGRVFTAIL